MAKKAQSRKGAPRSAKPASRQVEDLFAGRYPPRPEGGPVDDVDPRWLLKAAAVAVGAALLCAYATLCLLVYQGQWQLVLQPAAATPITVAGVRQDVRFGAGETGQPQLAGLWLPAADGQAGAPTILYLAGGAGNLAHDANALVRLHDLPVNVFAFDYRGFGASAATPRPNQVRMAQDAETAFEYLVSTRHITPSTIVPYGVGLGGALAAGLASAHRTPAVIVEAPRADATGMAMADSRARLVPLRLFFHERFDLGSVIASLKTPKLLLESGPSYNPHPTGSHAFSQLAGAAASPCMTVHLGDAGDPAGQTAQWRAAMLRFLDEYLAIPPSAVQRRQIP